MAASVAAAPPSQVRNDVDVPQHMRALERANQVRLKRSALKGKVAQGEITAVEVILDCPWEAESMAIGDLLMSQPRWGKTRTWKFLAQIPMSEKKPVGALTERQRRTLAATLHAQCRRPCSVAAA